MWADTVGHWDSSMGGKVQPSGQWRRKWDDEDSKLEGKTQNLPTENNRFALFMNIIIKESNSWATRISATAGSVQSSIIIFKTFEIWELLHWNTGHNWTLPLGLFRTNFTNFPIGWDWMSAYIRQPLSVHFWSHPTHTWSDRPPHCYP